eukprot:3299746-Rhodomonas_salina.1
MTHFLCVCPQFDNVRTRAGRIFSEGVSKAIEIELGEEWDCLTGRHHWGRRAYCSCRLEAERSWECAQATVQGVCAKLMAPPVSVPCPAVLDMGRELVVPSRPLLHSKCDLDVRQGQLLNQGCYDCPVFWN